MDVRHLRQVMEICRSGGFARAAQTLGMSQPALSRSIARLEDELGVSLFDRAGGATRPTAYGRYVADRGPEVLQAVDSIEQEVRRLFTGQAGRLALGIGPGAIDWFEQHVLGPVIERFPDLSLTIFRERASLLADLLIARELDLVIAHAEAIIDRPDLVREAELKLDVGWVVRAGHPAAEFERPIPLEKLLAFPFALQAVSAELLRGLPAQLTPAQHDNLRAYSAQDYRLLTRICLLTDAVMIAPLYAVRDDLAAGRLQRLTVRGDKLSTATLAINAEGRHSPVIREILDIVHRHWPEPIGDAPPTP